MLNMTYIALRFSRYVNGVALQHGNVSREMFPDYQIDAITNGVHAPTWLSEPFLELLDRNIQNWRRDNLYLRNAIEIPLQEIISAHAQAKETLLAEVASRTGLVLNPRVLTLGFARRAATYKRADLLFTDPDRLLKIAQAAGGLQILYAGKAHPQDEPVKPSSTASSRRPTSTPAPTCASSISKTTTGSSAHCSPPAWTSGSTPPSAPTKPAAPAA